MPNAKPDFVKIVITLAFIAFVIGFALALFSAGATKINYKFVLNWEMLKAVLFLVSLAPSILFVSSALAMESLSDNTNFVASTRKIMLPTMIFAALVSIFYILFVPMLEAKVHNYETKSRLFSESIRLAEEAFKANHLADTDRYLHVCASINRFDARYIDLYDKSKLLIEKAEYEKAKKTGKSDSNKWDEANKLYISALEFQKKGNIFEAHNLSKAALALCDTRADIKHLVDETWRALQVPTMSPQSQSDAAFYKKKLEGYAYFQESNYLEAFRIFSKLKLDNQYDADVKLWLERSQEKLSEIAFFIEEDEKAFSGSSFENVDLKISGLNGWTAKIQAKSVAVGDEAIWFRDMNLAFTSANNIKVKTMYARLYGNTLVLRAMDRNKPQKVWEPIYEGGQVLKASADASKYAITLPFDNNDVAMAISLAGQAKNIPVALLVRGLKHVSRFNIDPSPLYLELARRMTYPFVVLILVLFGSGLGFGFRAKEPVPFFLKLISAIPLTALSFAIIKMSSKLGLIFAKVIALFGYQFFIMLWVVFLCLCLGLSLFISAKIANSNS